MQHWSENYLKVARITDSKTNGARYTMRMALKLSLKFASKPHDDMKIMNRWFIVSQCSRLVLIFSQSAVKNCLETGEKTELFGISAL